MRELGLVVRVGLGGRNFTSQLLGNGSDPLGAEASKIGIAGKSMGEVNGGSGGRSGQFLPVRTYVPSANQFSFISYACQDVLDFKVVLPRHGDAVDLQDFIPFQDLAVIVRPGSGNDPRDNTTQLALRARNNGVNQANAKRFLKRRTNTRH